MQINAIRNIQQPFLHSAPPTLCIIILPIDVIVEAGFASTDNDHIKEVSPVLRAQDIGHTLVSAHV